MAIEEIMRNKTKIAYKIIEALTQLGEEGIGDIITELSEAERAELNDYFIQVNNRLPKNYMLPFLGVAEWFVYDAYINKILRENLQKYSEEIENDN
jgi:hypothetical protein